MSVPESLTKLVGNWRGNNTLHVPWLDPPQSTSDAAATITAVVRGKFLTIAYTWADHGEPHEGLLMLGQRAESGVVTGAWIDSWHQSGSILHSTGGVDGDGAVTLHAKYPAPPDADWGWRTVITARGSDAFDVIMTNITPNGEEVIAVETYYTRAE